MDRYIDIDIHIYIYTHTYIYSTIYICILITFPLLFLILPTFVYFRTKTLRKNDL